MLKIPSDFLLALNLAKSKAAKWQFIALILFAFVLLYVGQESNNVPAVKKEYIAKVYINGFIDEDSKRISSLYAIAKDNNIKGIVLAINSPGGSAYAGEQIYRAFREISKSKPVVCVMEGMATSAGYMIALGAEHIIAGDTTLTGSIGALIQTFNVTELSKKLGVEPQVFKTSPLKAIPSPFEPLTAEGKAMIDSMLNDIRNVFVEMLVESRKFTKDKANHFADGRVFSGRQAAKLGLIDAIGNEQQALAWLRNNKHLSEKISVKDYEFEDEKFNLKHLRDIIDPVKSYLRFSRLWTY